MTRKLTRLISGAVLIGLCVLGAAWHAAALCGLNWGRVLSSPTAILGLVGFGFGFLFFWGRAPFSRLYTLLHECCHAGAALLTGRRVRRLRVWRRGGSVQVERPNVFVVLAPYVVPLGPLAVAAVLAIVWFFERQLLPLPVGAALLGVAFAWHAAHTIAAVRTRQPDFDYAGPVLSLSIIIAANLTVLYWGLAGMVAMLPSDSIF